MTDGKVTILIDAESKEAEDGLDRVQDKTEQLGDTAEDSGKRSEAGLGAAALAATAVSASLIAATKAAVDYAGAFDTAFAKTQTIMDENAVSAREMRDSVLDLSAATGMAATDVSEAVYQAISGSVATAEAVGFVDRANRLAVAGFTELTNATDILTTVLNAYGMEAEQVGGISNVLIRTQNLGKTSVDELSGSMGKAIATGSAYGVNLQNIATSYVELTRGGIATAEATTYLSGMLNELGKAGSGVAKILQEQTGQSFGQMMADGATLGDVLQVLYDSVNNDAEAFMNLWGSQEAAKAANALLTQGLEDFNAVAATMNDELAGMTGTTDAAYATMTNTAEFVEKRFNNAIKNLGITYGEKLTPFLTKATEGLTKFVEGVTEFVDRNPQTVALMTGMATALAALAAGYGGLLVAKKAAAAVEALNLAMSANPAWAAAAAVAALTAGLVTMIGVMNADMNQAFEEATGSARELNEALTDGKRAMEDNLVSIEASASMAGHYIDRLEELDAISERTTEQQEEYHSLLVLLTQTVPELADKIDLETDAIEGGTEAIRADTEAWKENARAKAMQDYLADVYAKQAAVLVETEANQIKLDNAREKSKAVQKELAALEQRKNALTKQANDEARRLTQETGHLVTAESLLVAGHGELADAYQETNAAIDAQFDALGECAKEIDTHSRALEADKDAAAAASAEIEVAEQAVENLTGAAGEAEPALEGMGDAAEGAAGDTKVLDDAVTALQEAYNAAKADAETSILRQVNLFDQAAQVVPADIGTITAALQSNADYMVQYAENLRKAAELGVNQGLLKHLSDGSVESAKILAGIVADEGQHIDEMNQAWQRVEEGKDTLAGELALYDDEVTAAADAMVSTAGQAGYDIGAQLTEELSGRLPAFLGVIGQYVSAVRDLQNSARSLTNRGYSTTTNYYAGGTYSAAAGYAIVGEEGPELVLLRGGERILSADETRAAASQIVPYAPYISWTGSTAPGAAGRSQTETTIIVPVQLDGREIARSTATYMGEEMAFEVM